MSEAAPPPAFVARADEVLGRYPASRRSAALPLLHLWQEEFGFISDAAIEWIAGKLGLQPVHILELVTFYPMFRQRAYGRFHIKVCRTLSCALGGGHELFETFRKRLGLEGDPHDGPLHSPDGRFTLEYVECLASCGTPPVCMVNEDFHEKVGDTEAEAILARCA